MSSSDDESNLPRGRLVDELTPGMSSSMAHVDESRSRPTPSFSPTMSARCTSSAGVSTMREEEVLLGFGDTTVERSNSHW